MRETVIQWAYKEKIVAIVRGIEPEKCLKVAQALYDGGIRMMEITYDQRNPDSWETTAASIGQIAKAFEGRMLVGAGTVTSTHLVELTHKAGGLFIISPNVNTDVIRRTRELGMVSMPGALTPTDVVTALQRFYLSFAKDAWFLQLLQFIMNAVESVYSFSEKEIIAI